MKRRTNNPIGLLLFALTIFVSSCAIENDIPYPIVEGLIEAMEVEGQCDAEGNKTTQATINKKDRTVTLYVDDSVNKTHVRITKLTVSNNATYKLMDSTKCANPKAFPNVGFASLDSLPSSFDTRVDFTNPVKLMLHTYQDYLWTVNVTQIIKRNIVLENQVGEAVVDEISRQVVIYVTESQPLNKIKVTSFDLGGANGSVVPNPCEQEYFNFSEPATFYVSYGWDKQKFYEWKVFVHQKKEEQSLKANVFPMATKAYFDGSVVGGQMPSIEYKKQEENSWQTLPEANIHVANIKYTADLHGLTPGTVYEYRITVGGKTGSAQTFTTAPATPIPNGSLDNWHQDGRLWNPWSSGDDTNKFWDTGNRGATTVGESNSIPTSETSTGSGQAALLQSKWIVLKFAAGNIFTGEYWKTTGTNGELKFGRPFTSFPAKLRFNYKYNCSTINRVGDDDYAYLKGRPDTANVYIALTDWDEPLMIRTRPSERQLFDRNDPHIIAFAELLKGENVNEWTQVDLDLQYRYTNRTPKYILIVASSSKYGDFFTGGDTSKLWIDNFELIYE